MFPGIIHEIKNLKKLLIRHKQKKIILVMPDK